MFEKTNIQATTPVATAADPLASSGAEAHMKSSIALGNRDTPGVVEGTPDLAGQSFSGGSGRTADNERAAEAELRSLMRDLSEPRVTVASRPAVVKAPSVEKVALPPGGPGAGGSGVSLAMASILGGLGPQRRASGPISDSRSSAASGSGRGPKDKRGERADSEPESKKIWFETIKEVSAKAWGTWGRLTDRISQPWGTVVKWGAPAIGATCGLVWFQTVVQLGILGVEVFGGLLTPLLGVAAFLGPMMAADRILQGIEKVLGREPLSGWKRQAILRPVQGGLLAGAAIWTQAMELTPLMYCLWTAGAAATGYVITKLFQSARATTWAAVGTAAVLPWSHLATQRTFDVTVLNAGPDPEVAAWNVTTDLQKSDHWARLLFLAQQRPPSGEGGMVFLNKDVPLYLPPHREANEFHGHFANLVGKKVRVTTVGGWLKPISSHLQPTIVKYEVLKSSMNEHGNSTAAEQASSTHATQTNSLQAK